MYLYGIACLVPFDKCMDRFDIQYVHKYLLMRLKVDFVSKQSQFAAFILSFSDACSQHASAQD